jgi:hypothetical protein
MKKSELIKWLELYNDDLPVKVDTSEGLVEPTAIKKDGNVLVLYNLYDITGEELMYHNVTNVIMANKESSDIIGRLEPKGCKYFIEKKDIKHKQHKQPKQRKI